MQKHTVAGFRLSPQQKQLWLLQQEDQHTFYCAQATIALEGELDRQTLDEALYLIVERHEILRTTFARLPEMEFPLQVVGETAAPFVREHDLRGLARGEQDSHLEAIISGARQIPSGATQDIPPVSFDLAALSADRHMLIITLPALCADSAALEIITRELSQAYEESARGERSEVKQLQYADLSEWFNELLESEETETGREYWSRYDLSGLHSGGFPFERAAGDGFTPRSQAVPVGKHLQAELASLAAKHETTTAVLLLACWQALLWRRSGQAGLVVGVTYDGRKYPQLSDRPGLLARQVPIAAELSEGLAFEEFLGRLDTRAREAHGWQEYFIWKDAEGAAAGGAARRTFFPLCFAYEEQSGRHTAGGVAFRLAGRHVRLDRFNLKLSCVERDDDLLVELEYDASLLTAGDAERMADALHALLSDAVARPASAIDVLEVLGEREREKLLVGFNQTKAEYPGGLSLHGLFEAQAARTPDAVAVSFDSARLTYAELEARANRLAHHLRELGVGAESLVGICAERSIEMVVGLLGVLKAGGAYVPLEPAYPRERLSFMLDNARVSILLTQEHLLEKLSDAGARVVCLDADRASIDGRNADSPRVRVRGENPAYVIYTSGSTGRPKGVVISHAAICNHMMWMQSAFPLDTSDAVLQKTPFSFDASVWEFYAPLMAGARLVMAEPGGHQDSSYLVKAIEEERITTLQTVPALLRMLLAEPGFKRCRSLKRVFCGGEPLTVDLREQLYGQLDAVKLYNLYGPTEATVEVSSWECERGGGGRVVPIGRPIANAQMYVLDRHLKPVAWGAVGELYLGGAGLARGYLNLPALTAEKFIPDPFGTQPGARLYRTGDLARHLSGGEVEFLGRADHQVKVRGFRIELGEIEAVLMEHPSVRETVALAREGAAEEKQLVAYLVAAVEGQPPADHELRGHLKERLPDYMTPAAFVVLERLPLTPNGKVDRAALPPPPSRPEFEAEGGHDAPCTLLEETLAGIWSELLGVESPGVHDDFFELGGHSLLATQLMSRVRETFQVELSVRRLFESPTLAGLASVVEAELRASQGVSAPPIRRASREQPLPLSFAQQRLWFLDQLEPGSISYNSPLAVRLSGTLDTDALARTLDELTRRHEALRTHFAELDGQPVQVVEPVAACRLELVELSDAPSEDVEAAAQRLAAQEAARPFDLGRGPLLRATLLQLAETEHVLLVTMHHIISDGWSLGVLVKEVAALYEAFAEGRPSPLAELPIQYADFAVWQREWLQGDALENLLDYWRGKLGGALPELRLPLDHPRPAVRTPSGAHQTRHLPVDLADEVRALSRVEGSTVFMTLLAAFQLLLSRYSQQEDILTGTAIANRNRGETEGLIGFFVNMLVLRTDLSGDPTFAELLKRVREVALGAYAHQDVPFERLVEEFAPERSASRTPLVQVAFGLNNSPMPAMHLPGLTLKPLEIEEDAGRFDLTLWLTDDAGTLVATWYYNTDLFEPATIERMHGHFETLLRNITARPEACLSAFEMLTDEEQRQQSVERARRQESLSEKLRSSRRRPAAVVSPLAQSPAELTPLHGSTPAGDSAS
jgi:amino acid adenylation domain-containing protein